MYLTETRKDKWLRSRKSRAGPQTDKETQKKQIEIAKNLFLTWDADGEGSLSPAEIIKAFVSIGLSQDHHFARKIMHSIRPHKENDENMDICLKDFIKIFKNDEVSDNVIKMINEEV
jgi:Ca2+-binding EF-hand superfamily protein